MIRFVRLLWAVAFVTACGATTSPDGSGVAPDDSGSAGSGGSWSIDSGSDAAHDSTASGGSATGGVGFDAGSGGFVSLGGSPSTGGVGGTLIGGTGGTGGFVATGGTGGASAGAGGNGGAGGSDSEVVLWSGSFDTDSTPAPPFDVDYSHVKLEIIRSENFSVCTSYGSGDADGVDSGYSGVEEFPITTDSCWRISNERFVNVGVAFYGGPYTAGTGDNQDPPDSKDLGGYTLTSVRRTVHTFTIDETLSIHVTWDLLGTPN